MLCEVFAVHPNKGLLQPLFQILNEAWVVEMEPLNLRTILGAECALGSDQVTCLLRIPEWLRQS